MKNKDALKKLRIPKVSDGNKRDWIKCKKCGEVYFYDYLPFGIGTPITWLKCGHDFGTKIYLVTDIISETEAVKFLLKRANQTRKTKGE